jgi:hypothetical protein
MRPIGSNMGLTAEDVVSALTVCCGEEPDGPAEAVAIVRQSQPSFAATLYSVWRAEGAELDPGLDYELRVAESRIERFRSVAADLAQQVPDLMPIKGLEVAAAYPAGIVRTMNDLDYVALAEPDLWRAVGHLVKDGWELHTATFTQSGGDLRILVSLRQPFESPYVMPYGIEIANYLTLGDLNGVPPLLRLPDEWRAPVVKNVLMLIFERFEQRYRARDLVDASLVLGSASADERAALAAAITQLELQPEYAELARLVAATTLPPLPLPAGRRAHPVTRVRRMARSVGFLRHPISGAARHLQRRVVNGKARRYERRPWAVAQRRLLVADALRAGLLAFGLPLDAPAPPVETAVVRTRGELAWVDTPVGRFLLTIGDDVTEEDVEELST